MPDNKRTTISRREFLRWSSMLGAGAVLVACNPNAPAPAAPAQSGAAANPAPSNEGPDLSSITLAFVPKALNNPVFEINHPA